MTEGHRQRTTVTLTEYSEAGDGESASTIRDAEISTAAAFSEAGLALSLGLTRCLDQDEDGRDLMLIEIIGTDKSIAIETEGLLAAMQFLLAQEEEDDGSSEDSDDSSE